MKTSHNCKSVSAMCNRADGCPSMDKSIFCSLEEGSLEKLNQEKFSRFYKKGQTIFFEGHPHHGIFCINSGKVKLVKNTSGGQETILRIASSGDAIGGISFLNRGVYAVTATVLEDATICLITDDVMKDLLQQDRTLAINMIRRWDEEIARADEVAHALAHKSSKAKLAFMLLYLSQIFGEDRDEGRFLDVQLSRDEYAALIGVASENVIRCFADLKKEGLLFEDKKRIFITDMQKLKQIAN